MNTQNFCFVLKQNSHLLREGCFGLEKENVRVNQDGTLALTPHPAVFGDKGKHPYITTDFSESQVEMMHIIRESSRTRSITVRNLPEPTERKGSLFREYTSISLSRKN